MYVKWIVFDILMMFVLKVSSGDLQRFIFGEQYSIFERDHPIEPTPAKRLKSTNTTEENEEVRFKFDEWIKTNFFFVRWF